MGNVGGVRGHSGEDSKGTKHFSSGTKVYCLPPMWGDGYEKVLVIGKHRGSPRLVRLAIPRSRITNWRVQSVHDPGVLTMLGNSFEDRPAPQWRRADAEAMAKTLRNDELAPQPQRD